MTANRLPVWIASLALSGALMSCSAPDHLAGLEGDVAFLEENLVPVDQVEGPLYQWALPDEGLERADTPPQAVGGVEALMLGIRYPQGARRRCATGDVMVRFVVAEDGRVIAAEPIEPVDPALDVMATAAVARWRFEPGTKAGEPVKVITRMPISFNLAGCR